MNLKHQLTMALLFNLACMGCHVRDGKVKDIDGNVYRTTTIDTLVWMAENLKTTRYNDGTAIPYVTDAQEWAGLDSGAFCFYANDIFYNKDTYGALYNWYAVSSDKLCPAGWHIPTDEEWNALTAFLGGETKAGSKLKDTVMIWNSPYEDATNETGFTALPGGCRDSNGYYYDLGFSGMWWTAEEFYSSSALYRMIYYDPTLQRNFIDKKFGMSVRCVKD